MPPAESLDPVDAALAQLRAAIEQKLRAEQLVDRLTGLGNNVALEEWFQAHLEQGTPFWAAFVEVDEFKRINDKFGYSDSDVFLQRIAAQLRNTATSHFAATVVPFRAHGDEFFLAGPLDADADSVGAALELLRQSIAQIRVAIRGGTPALKGTVSIGWLTSEDSRASDDELKEASIRKQLELAVGVAKRTRNAVCRFQAGMAKEQDVDGRADCSGCRTKFTFRTPPSGLKEEELFCPNCGARTERPPRPPA